MKLWKCCVSCCELHSYIIHFWLDFLYPFDEKIFKFCKLEFGIAFCFKILIGIWHSGRFFLYFSQASLKLERPALKIQHRLCCRTDICSWKLSANVSLMLDNPFPVPFLCKLKHTSVYFISMSMRITCK